MQVLQDGIQAAHGEGGSRIGAIGSPRITHAEVAQRGGAVGRAGFLQSQAAPVAHSGSLRCGVSLPCYAVILLAGQGGALPGQSVTHDQLGIAAEFDHDAIAYAELRGSRGYGYALQ